jgi:CBS-domain-containing membrane protein
MNIQTVKTNLEKTIAGKEEYLSNVRKEHRALQNLEGSGARGREMALNATQEFLEINIDELKRILQDVEQCCEKETT